MKLGDAKGSRRRGEFGRALFDVGNLQVCQLADGFCGRHGRQDGPKAVMMEHVPPGPQCILNHHIPGKCYYPKGGINSGESGWLDGSRISIFGS